MMAGLSAQEKSELLVLLDEWEKAKERESSQRQFLPFVKSMWPAFIEGEHHKTMALAFEKVARGECKRMIINIAPRHTKSEFASYMLPAWFLGNYPNKKIIQCSHTAELAVGFGRKVRNLVASEDYRKVFPDVALQQDSKAAGRWSTNQKGEYFAIGVGGAVTGKGADLLIIDDPHSEQEAALGDPSVYNKTYEWYTSGPRQRLQPGGAIIIVMCMVGDTDVLMADGSTTKLRDIRPGDLVATYEGGRISTSKVVNHRSNGVDAIFIVQTRSGRILRANERHPFLVEIGGERKWVRLKDLKVGMELVATKVAKGHQELKQDPGFVGHVRLQSRITKRIQTLRIALSGIMENGKDWFAKAAKVFRQKQKACAAAAIQSGIRQESQRHLKEDQGGLKAAMASRLSSMKAWLLNAITSVISAVSSLANKTFVRIGTANSALTIATKQGKSGAFSATTATLQSGTESLPASCVMPLNTYSVTTDAIVKISPDGYEEVFDVQIDRTENFIANGVVSHNTRWHQRDLTGRVIKSSIERGGTDEWEVIELPAILPSGNPLWPEFWSLKELEAIRAELPVAKWSAQYQQNPTAEEGALVKREWWRLWEKEAPPACDFIIQSWDTAFTKKQTSDFSACTTWGVFKYPMPETGIMGTHIILLDAFKERMEFPELKRKAYEMYEQYRPDAFIVEAKAAGAPLIYELRAMGIPVSEYTPSRGNDKVARVNAVSDLFSSGNVWCPPTRWAEEVVEEFAAFPNAEHDDLVDSSTQALLRFRQGGFIAIDTDEPIEKLPRRRITYY